MYPFIFAGLTEVYSWGNGANYHLGIGIAGIQRIPYRLDALQNVDVTHVAPAKFHSATVIARGAYEARVVYICDVL